MHLLQYIIYILVHKQVLLNWYRLKKILNYHFVSYLIRIILRNLLLQILT